MIDHRETPPRPPPGKRESTVETLSMQLETIKSELNKRRDTGRFKTTAEDFAKKVDAALTVRDAQRRDEFRKNARGFLFALLGSGILGGGGFFVWGASHPPVVEASDVKRAVEDQGAEFKAKVDENTDRVGSVEAAVDRLEDITVEQQVQLVDGIEYLGKKIDAVSPRAARVEEPKTLEQARKKVAKERARRDLFKE